MLILDLRGERATTCVECGDEEGAADEVVRVRVCTYFLKGSGEAPHAVGGV